MVTPYVITVVSINLFHYIPPEQDLMVWGNSTRACWSHDHKCEAPLLQGTAAGPSPAASRSIAKE